MTVQPINAESFPVRVSIVIVNYRVPDHLRETLRSIYQAEQCETAEVIVVDNASGDQSQQWITEEFPSVLWIQLKHNIGFGKACNVGVQNSRAPYVLLLNPDTMIGQNTLSIAYTFMEANQNVGLMGPKILNPDGTLQAACKRGFPTPAVSFYHFSGLSRLFPKSRRFGRYHLSFLDPDVSSGVDAVSGSFMFLRRELFLEIGGFDEQFFLYGEDLDLCYRIHENGFAVWYHPETQIIHRKGKSSAKNLLRSRIAFYEAMVLFSRKYRHVHQGFLPRWIVFITIVMMSLLNIGMNIVRYYFSVVVDLSIINVVLSGVILLRFSPESNPYHILGFWSMLGIHSLLSASFLFMYAYNGIYAKRKKSIGHTLLSGLLASSLFNASVYFLSQFAVSRIAFAVSSVICTFFLAGWRELAPQALKGLRSFTFTHDKIVLVGNGPLTDKIIHGIEKNRQGIIIGIIWNNGTLRPGEYEGYPVLGCLDEVNGILTRYRVDTLIVTTHQPWYSHIIDVLSNAKVKNLTVRWVPHDLTALPAEKLPEEIPLRDFSV